MRSPLSPLLRLGLSVAALAVIFVPAAAHAQLALGARIGVAGGSHAYMVLEGHGRVHTMDNVYLTVNVETMGGVWACSESPLEDIRCGYDGNSFLLGAAFAPVDRRKTFLAVSGGIGAFVRTSSYSETQYNGIPHLAARLGLEGEVRIIGPVRLQAAIAHRRIFDATYAEAVGYNPHYTGLSVGLAVVGGR